MTVFFMFWNEFMWFYSSYDHFILMNCLKNGFLKNSTCFTVIKWMLIVNFFAFWKKQFLSLIEVSMCTKVFYMRMFNFGERISSMKKDKNEFWNLWSLAKVSCVANVWNCEIVLLGSWWCDFCFDHESNVLRDANWVLFDLEVFSVIRGRMLFHVGENVMP